jgi:DNA-binding CsgD family transcriptional regulator
MVDLPAGALEIAVEIAAIASAPATIAERAEAVLHTLRRAVPIEAAQIALVNLDRREVVLLAVHGYDDAVRAYSTSPEVVDEFELLGLQRPGPPMRLSDLPVPLSEVRGWTEYLAPAGFHGGLCVGLGAPGGRHIGILALNTDTEVHPTVAARDLIGVLAPMITQAVDPLRSIAAGARLVHDARAGIVLTRAGEVLPLPGLPTDPLLDEGSAVLTLATHLARKVVHASFLCPHPPGADEPGHVRITLVACVPEPPHYLTAAVVVSPPGDLRGLTPRELQLLGLLIEGWPNRRIAGVLMIAERTVAAHIEHILAKLGAGTRSLAAVRALNHGTYVPRALTEVAGHE